MPFFGKRPKSAVVMIGDLFVNWDELISASKVKSDFEAIVVILKQALELIEPKAKATAKEAALVIGHIEKFAEACMVLVKDPRENIALLQARLYLVNEMCGALSEREAFAVSISYLKKLEEGLNAQLPSMKKKVMACAAAEIADSQKTLRKAEMIGKTLSQIFAERTAKEGDSSQNYIDALGDVFFALEDQDELGADQLEELEELCRTNPMHGLELSSILSEKKGQNTTLLVDDICSIKLSVKPRLELLLKANKWLDAEHPFISEGVHSVLEPFRVGGVKQITGAIEARVGELEKRKPAQELLVTWSNLYKSRLALADAFEGLTAYIALRESVVAQLIKVDPGYVKSECPELDNAKIFSCIHVLSEEVFKPSEKFVIGKIDQMLKTLEGVVEGCFAELPEEGVSKLLAQLQECNQLLTVKCENSELSEQVGGLKKRLQSLKASWFGSSALKKVLKDKVIFYVQTVAAKGQDIAGADAKRATLFVGEFTEFSSSYSAIEVAQAWCAALLKTPGGSVDPTILDLPKSLMELPTDATGFYSEKKSEVLKEVALLYEAEEATVALPQASGTALFRPVSPQTEEGVVSGGFRPRSSPVDSATRGHRRRPSSVTPIPGTPTSPLPAQSSSVDLAVRAHSGSPGSTTSVSPPPSYIQAVHEKQRVLEEQTQVVTSATASLV